MIWFLKLRIQQLSPSPNQHHPSHLRDGDSQATKPKSLWRRRTVLCSWALVHFMVNFSYVFGHVQQIWRVYEPLYIFLYLKLKPQRLRVVGNLFEGKQSHGGSPKSMASSSINPYHMVKPFKPFFSHFYNCGKEPVIAVGFQSTITIQHQEFPSNEGCFS